MGVGDEEKFFDFFLDSNYGSCFLMLNLGAYRVVGSREVYVLGQSYLSLNTFSGLIQRLFF
jgi:hypothetical protein